MEAFEQLTVGTIVIIMQNTIMYGKSYLLILELPYKYADDYKMIYHNTKKEKKRNLPGVSRTPDLKITNPLQSRALASLATESSLETKLLLQDLFQVKN